MIGPRLAAAWAGSQIPFHLVRSDRKTLSISVGPDGDVLVRAPRDACEEEIIARVSRRGGWIRHHQARAALWKPRTPPRTFEPGETHLYLGRQYRLAVQIALREQVAIIGGHLTLMMHRPRDVEGRRALLERWYLERGREVFRKRLDSLFGHFEALGHQRPRLIVRDLRQRWGSLTSAGNMVLSRDLVRAPRACIDYVILHELCHLEVPDHGPAFWALLDSLMPDHRRRKQRLERALL